MARGDDIQERLIKFAVRIIKICKQLPKDQPGKHIGNQLLRSGTSPAANYGEARSAESSPDFIHKLKISVKELNESEVWLRIIGESQMANPSSLGGDIDECQQLQRILNASIRTARKSYKSR